jgi:hypothetical protein
MTVPLALTTQQFLGSQRSQHKVLVDWRIIIVLPILRNKQ